MQNEENLLMHGKWDRYVFLSLLVLILSGISYAHWKGQQQDEQFLKDYTEYQQAVQLMQQGRAEQALPLLRSLLGKYPDRYNIMRTLGLAYAMKNDFQKAAFYYEKAIRKRPFLQQDPIFTLQFGEILYYNGEYAKAKAYLEKSKQLPGSETYHARIDELLSQIQYQKSS
ncbi:Tetratricopeptide repeat protein [Geobacillus sp. BCO2]|nr:Tetratricopeptide repeat protein [Geobacillus sp. BCO2]